MYYNKQQLDRCSPKLLALLWKQDHIAGAERGSLALEPVIAQIIRVAREEKHAFVYISAMCDMLFFELTFHEVRKAIQYGELFLREGRKIFEEALPTDTSPGAFQQNYMICFEVISKAYMGFPQISIPKMEQFFALFHENMRLYGNEILYDKCRLAWENICLNTGAAKLLARKMETAPMHHQCYVCTMEQVNHARILLGDLEGALAHSANVIAGNVPEESRGRYETCACASAYAQYTDLFHACLLGGRIELLDRVLPLAYPEVLVNGADGDVCGEDALVQALCGDFTLSEAYTKEACVIIDEEKLYLPYEHMHACLEWMVYFKRLCRSGTERIAFPTKEPVPLEGDGEGKYSAAEIADYFERTADEIGQKFEKSRAHFGYARRKESYLALLERKFASCP